MVSTQLFFFFFDYYFRLYLAEEEKITHGMTIKSN